MLTKRGWFDIINKLSRKRAKHKIIRNLKETWVSLSFLLTKSVRKQNKFQKSVDKGSRVWYNNKAHYLRVESTGPWKLNNVTRKPVITLSELKDYKWRQHYKCRTLKSELEHQALRWLLSRKTFNTIILESLILAQDERWRHA